MNVSCDKDQKVCFIDRKDCCSNKKTVTLRGYHIYASQVTDYFLQCSLQEEIQDGILDWSHSQTQFQEGNETAREQLKIYIVNTVIVASYISYQVIVRTPLLFEVTEV
jgi:hypothetical protein